MAFGTKFEQNTDYVKMAESMGVRKAFRINSYAEIGEVLNNTLNLNDVVVIDIPIDERGIHNL